MITHKRLSEGVPVFPAKRSVSKMPDPLTSSDKSGHPLPHLIFTHIFCWTPGVNEQDEQGSSTWR